MPIYVLVALLFGIYIPELFPTEVRLRASGIVNTLGRGATIVTPFLVVMLFEARGVAGVMALMIGLLVVQIVTVWALGIEPRHRSLEELKGGGIRVAGARRRRPEVSSWLHCGCSDPDVGAQGVMMPGLSRASTVLRCRVSERGWPGQARA